MKLDLRSKQIELDNLVKQLNNSNSVVREYIINHCEAPDEIKNPEGLIDYCEGKLDECIASCAAWHSLTFKKKEALYGSFFTEGDIAYFKKKGWIT